MVIASPDDNHRRARAFTFREACPRLVAVALAACGVAGIPAAGAGKPGPGPAATRNSLGMSLVVVPPGEFWMGSPVGEDGRQDNEGPEHRVRITRAFEIGAHEVTVAQFRAFAEASRYRTEAERDVGGGFGIDFETGEVVQDSRANWRTPGFPGFLQGDDHPVLMVSWSDAEAFCRWLSGKEGRAYRLPTEAEWEYAARAGRRGNLWSGIDGAELATTANLADASLRRSVPAARWSASWPDGHAFTAPVGSYRPNAWGLYDMTGNVWEWGQDWYGADYYATSPVDDPQGPATGGFRTIRGGGWWNPPVQSRVAQRIYFKPSFRYCLLSGFRVVRDLRR